jgi:hypothetical protein
MITEKRKKEIKRCDGEGGQRKIKNIKNLLCF